MTQQAHHWRDLIRPKALDVDKESLTSTYGQFVLKPLERGYGLTLGNSLRRVLLNSLPGSAIVGIKVAGVTSLAGKMPGMTESVEDVFMNLKEVRIKMSGDKATIKIEKSGAGVVRASDVQVSGDITVLNPDAVIGTLESGSFKAELYVVQGRGYSRTEEAPIEIPSGFISIDGFYSPVRRVNYAVTQTRVGERTDYDKLSFEVWTDGSIRPEEAVSIGSKILRDQLAVFMNFDDVEEPTAEMKIDSSPQYNRNLLRSVDEFELSVRSSNCLQTMGVKYVWQLVQKTEADIMKTRNMGRKSLNEINDMLKNLGLGLGMKLEGFTPPEQPVQAPDSDIDESRILKDRLEGDEDEDFDEDFED